MYINHIFREYDIRGVVHRDYDRDFARMLGRAVARKLFDRGGRRVAVSQDCRISSPELAEALIAGMVESGLHVIDLGVNATPMLYFSLFQLEVDGGVQVSGSHNPPDQNGFKVCLGQETLHGEQIQELRRVIEQGDFPQGPGRAETRSIADDYANWIGRNIKLARPLKVVLDSGNGTAGPVAPRILRGLGCEVIDLFSEMDGRFPNHHPDPTVGKNLTALIETVEKTGADLGIGYDGDADRIGVVDDRGRVVFGDLILMLLARAVLAEVPGAVIVGEVKCSHRLFRDIQAHGGRGIMGKAGHSLIKAKMRETGAALGGEMSGHIFFKHRYFGYDDAIYSGCRLLELVANSPRPLSAILDEIPRAVSTPELRIDSSDEKKFEIVRAATAFFKGRGLEVIDIDGARVVFADGWGLVRASNTQPMLVMRFEAESEPRLAEIRALVEGKINELNK